MHGSLNVKFNIALGFSSLSIVKTCLDIVMVTLTLDLPKQLPTLRTQAQLQFLPHSGRRSTDRQCSHLGQILCNNLFINYYFSVLNSFALKGCTILFRVWGRDLRAQVTWLASFPLFEMRSVASVRRVPPSYLLVKVVLRIGRLFT